MQDLPRESLWDFLSLRYFVLTRYLSLTPVAILFSRTDTIAHQQSYRRDSVHPLTVSVHFHSVGSTAFALSHHSSSQDLKLGMFSFFSEAKSNFHQLGGEENFVLMYMFVL